MPNGDVLDPAGLNPDARQQFVENPVDLEQARRCARIARSGASCWPQRSNRSRGGVSGGEILERPIVAQASACRARTPCRTWQRLSCCRTSPATLVGRKEGAVPAVGDRPGGRNQVRSVISIHFTTAPIPSFLRPEAIPGVIRTSPAARATSATSSTTAGFRAELRFESSQRL